MQQTCRMIERKNARTKAGRRVFDLYAPNGEQVLEIVTDANGVWVMDGDLHNCQYAAVWTDGHVRRADA